MRFSLSQIIDLQLQFERDRGLARRELVLRDAQIGRELRQGGASDGKLIHQWMRRVAGNEPSTGKDTVSLLQTATVLAALAGTTIGASVLMTWLAMDSGTPSNVIYLWTVAVGVQLVLLAVLLLLVLPAPWLERIPGFSGLAVIARGGVFLVSRSVQWCARRLAAQRSGGGVESTLQRLRMLDKQYDHLRTLLALRLTQTFAVAFNVGAIAALFIGSTISDPAFGWRSRLLEKEQVHRMAEVIATPWRPVLGERAAPTLPQVEQTLYMSIEAGHPVDRENPKPWHAWFPFLAASLITYGLLPRVILLIALQISLYRWIARLPSHHADFAQLLDRLQRVDISTTATDADPDAAAAGESAPPHVSHTHLSNRAYDALRWAGVKLDESSLGKWLGNECGGSVASFHTIGTLDAGADAAALQAVRPHADRPVLLLVAAWEPPVGDYLDFLTEARRQLGDRRMIHILLYQPGSGGMPGIVAAGDQQVWQRRVERLADPWITVEPMVQGVTL